MGMNPRKKSKSGKPDKGASRKRTASLTPEWTRARHYAAFILRIFFIRRLRAAAFFFLRITLGFS